MAAYRYQRRAWRRYAVRAPLHLQVGVPELRVRVQLSVIADKHGDSGELSCVRRRRGEAVGAL